MRKTLGFLRRLLVCIPLWPLLLVCTYLILVGFGKDAADDFWASIT